MINDAVDGRIGGRGGAVDAAAFGALLAGGEGREVGSVHGANG